MAAFGAEDQTRVLAATERMATALSHHLRLRILVLLCEGPCEVLRLAERLGVERSVASKHLGHLALAGLVAARREKKFHRYELSSSISVEAADGRQRLMIRSRWGIEISWPVLTAGEMPPPKPEVIVRASRPSAGAESLHPVKPQL